MKKVLCFLGWVIVPCLVVMPIIELMRTLFESYNSVNAASLSKDENLLIFSEFLRTKYFLVLYVIGCINLVYAIHFIQSYDKKVADLGSVSEVGVLFFGLFYVAIAFVYASIGLGVLFKNIHLIIERYPFITALVLLIFFAYGVAFSIYLKIKE